MKIFIVVLLSVIVGGVLCCSNNEDCFLNGVCTNGACVCDYSWSGATCNTMKFHPAPVGGAYGFSPNVTSWGGVPVLVGDTYHLLNTEIVNHCGLCNWGQNSRVIHATSKDLLGPYTFQNEALPLWSHNPHIIVDHSSGSPVYLLFHIGEANGGVTPAVCNKVARKEGISRRSPLASGVLHTATNPAGPWTPQSPPGLGGCNNPAPYVWPNGTVYLICSQGGTNIWTAANWKGPWKGGELVYTGNAGAGIWEDPFIWRDQRGHFKMIAHVYPQGGSSAHYWDRVSGFAYSYDAVKWVRQPWQPYTNVIQHTNGTIAYTTRERPKIFFDPKDNVTPLALFTGVARGTNCWDCKLQCGVDWTFNLAQAIAA
jgi:hypothetical protein